MINLDYASTTKPSKEVINQIAIALDEDYLNIGAKYKQAKAIEKKISIIRQGFLSFLGASNGEIIFCPSATAANNLAFSVINPKSKGKILVGAGEHSSVYETAKHLSNMGATVEFIPLGANGKIDLNAFENKLDSGVSFVSVMLVSNETGAINNLKQISKIVHSINPKAIVHTDAVQAFGKIDFSVDDIGVDMLTISAHKISGPKGIGALYSKNIDALRPIIYGGGQEYNLVSGTENFAYISGFYTAAKLKVNSLASDYLKVMNYRKHFLDSLDNANVEYEINGELDNSSPYILNISFKGVRGEVLLHALAEYDILVANGSACSSKKRGNRTLESMGKNKEQIDGAVRISFCANEEYNFAYIAGIFKKIIDEIRV
ncbi:MAG: cysteine desulfurase [Clostridia bacterium]|nr:cysteine desulfurase [Clostridia bacterium]